MRLHIVFNQEGDILAAVQLDPKAPVRARPIADLQKGHRVADIYVLAEYHHYDLGTICARLRVDVAAKFPELKPKGVITGFRLL